MERWLVAALIGLAGGTATAAERGTRGGEQRWDEPVVSRYLEPGGNDLLTGGLGAARLADPTPVAVDPDDPESLRTAAIFNNYRALVDTSAGGGYGRLYGPLVAPTDADAAGKVYGVEYLVLAPDAGDGNITLMVQIPQGFDPGSACIVTAPSSGSRGIYGAIGTAGEWGLKRGCAVAYTDKGTGTGAHDLGRDQVGLLRGERVAADMAGDRSTFTARLRERARDRFDARYPDRFAFKHAHGQSNPEARWGRHVLRSIEFAFFALNREFAAARAAGTAPWFEPGNTLVIASSVSNGGAASLRAGEIARPGLIDGIVVSEPNVNPVLDRRFAIRQGDAVPLRQHSRPLYDYLTLVDLYQGCANLAPANQAAPLNLTATTLGENRCRSLRGQGLLRSDEVTAQAEESQRIINGYGILPEQNEAAPGYWASYVAQAVAVTYANAYARASVRDNLCGFSFAAVDADPASATANRVVPLPEAAAATLFANANGIPPTAGVAVVNNDSPGGAVRDQVSASRSNGRQDQNLDGHLCLRSLIVGRPTLSSWASTERFRRQRLAGTIEQILATGRLGGIPTIVLHGRADALIAPNHSSRPYYALSRLQDGERSALSYLEITHGQHLDALNALPGFDERFIPLHHYFVQALDLMYAHLIVGDPLPPSQLVRTLPRGRDGQGVVPPIGPANLPPISLTPAEDARITFDGRTLQIPD